MFRAHKPKNPISSHHLLLVSLGSQTNYVALAALMLGAAKITTCKYCCCLAIFTSCNLQVVPLPLILSDGKPVEPKKSSQHKHPGFFSHSHSHNHFQPFSLRYIDLRRKTYFIRCHLNVFSYYVPKFEPNRTSSSRVMAFLGVCAEI